MGDSFFVNPSHSRKRNLADRGRSADASDKSRNARTQRSIDEDITSESDNDDPQNYDDANEVSDESDHESAIDKRRRLAKEYLSNLETELVEGFDAKDLDEDIIARRLQSDAAEQQGHIFRDLRDHKVGEVRKTRILGAGTHLTGVAAAANHVYVGSKNNWLSKWGYKPSGKLYNVRSVRLPHSVLCICVNSADKLVVVGHAQGFAVYNCETLELMRDFKTWGSALSLVFRKNTSELYVGGSDLRLRTYDLAQWAFVETLHGHQDQILGISALTQERCVSVGARDRTVIFWKIPEEARLTFRGGDTKLAAKFSQISVGDEELKRESLQTVLEGSIDCCAMLDHSLFVTGSDNGNVALWSTNRKKAQYMEALGHGKDAQLTAVQASGETDPSRVELPPALPRGITSIAAVPFSNTFFTGSWSSTIKMWSLSEDKRAFELIKEIEIGEGIVTSMCIAELDNKFRLLASVSREPRLGRWLKVKGRDQVVSVDVSA